MVAETKARLAEHAEALYSCRACPDVFGTPVTGMVGRTSVMLIGQAPGVHEVEDPRPFVYTAGRRLFSWFQSLGVSEEEFRRAVHIAAVIRCFPGKGAGGGDRVPSPEEIARCGAHLDREIRILSPKLVIAVGTLSASQLLGERELKNLVGREHRATRAGKSFDVVVLPHPSGRSTWLNKPENAGMLQQSLQYIARHPAFRKTFPGAERRAQS